MLLRKGPWIPVSKRHLAGMANDDEEVVVVFFGLDFGKIDVRVVHQIVREFLFRWALAIFVQRQAAAAVALETTI